MTHDPIRNGNPPPPTARTQVRRMPERGNYDRTVINQIIDEALLCHVAFIDNNHPFVIPMVHVRVEDQLYIHGSNGSRMLKLLGSGAPACINVSIIDGLVLARSAMHHSMNYRSVVVLSPGRLVKEKAEKDGALYAMVEHVIPGRAIGTRMPDDNELNATSVVAFSLHEASAKIRSGPPRDNEEDYALPFWAGVIPLSLQPGAPIPDDRLLRETAIPEHVTQYRTLAPAATRNS